MALVLADRVQETTTTSGTGSVTLAGAVAGFQTFAVVGNGNTCYYAIVNGSAWEVGVGTYSTAGPTLARTTILSNSSGNTSPITLSGSSNVFVTYPSEKSINLDASDNASPLGTIASGTWQGTTIGVAYGGTGQTTAAAAITALTGTQTSGQYLRSDGTNAALAAIQVADVPTLNQNTTGTAANVTGTVAIINGGTGETTANTALNALLPAQASNANKYLQTDGTNTSWDAVSLSTADITGTLPVANGGTGRTVGNYSVYSYEVHVSQVDGNDTTGDGTLINPVATITKALTLVTGDRRTVIIHPGTYTESPSITYQYTALTGPGLIGGNVVISGTVSTNIGCTISGLKITNLTSTTASGAGNVNILNCDISGTFTKSGTADYTLLRLTDFAAANITGAGVVDIYGGNTNFLTVNSASANVLVKNGTTVAPVLTSGTLSLVQTVVVAAVTNAVTSAAGTVITLANSQFLTSALTNVAPVVLNGFYSIFNCVFDKPNSTLVATSGTGGSTNSVDYFQTVNADNLVLTNDLPIAQGGTGQSTAAAAITALTGTQTSGYYLRSDGTNSALAAIVAGDVPTLNQNTTGTAANVTGIVAVVNGGTGASDATNARTNLTAAKSGANTDITSVALTTGTISTLPVSNTDIVNKQYADAIASGIHFHEAVDLATTAALPANTYNNGTSGVGATLTANANGALSVDSTVTVVGNRVLVKNEVTQANNGVYTVTQVGSAGTPYILTRATDFNTAGTGVNQIDEGDFFLVTSGTANINTAWVQQTPPPITVGTTAIVFQQFAAPITYTAGTGLSESPSYTFNIANTGTAGTYGSASAVPVFVTNAQGQVTSVTNTNIAISGSAVSGNITGQAGSVANALTAGTYLTSAGTFDGAAARTFAVDATDANTASKVVARDASGNFAAGTITAALSGNATTATTAGNVSGTVAVINGGTGQTTYTDGQILIGNTTGNTLTKTTLTAGSGISITNGSGAITIATTGGGIVTSVTGTSPVVSSGGTTPAISLASGYGDTLNPYASKTANYVLAAPNGTAGVPTFRAIVAADIPTLNQNTTGNAATATLATTATNLAGGIASQIPYQTGAGATSFITNGTAGQVLTSNGTSAPTFQSAGGLSQAKATAISLIFGL